MQRFLKKSLVSLVTVPFVMGLFLYSNVVSGDSLRIQPQQLNLSSAKPLSNVRFHNDSAEEVTLKFDVVQWQQKGDQEWLTPSGKLIMVPSKVTLKPGESEQVRVSMRLTGSFWDEESYRIMVTQNVRAPDIGSEEARNYKGRTSRPFSIPVFLQPPGKAKPRVSWTIGRNDQGNVVLRAINSGKGHVKLISASLLGPAGESIQKPRMSDIILPGGARSWEFPMNTAAGHWHLIADTNAGPMRAKLELLPHDESAIALRYER